MELAANLSPSYPARATGQFVQSDSEYSCVLEGGGGIFKVGYFRNVA